MKNKLIFLNITSSEQKCSNYTKQQVSEHMILSPSNVWRPLRNLHITRTRFFSAENITLLAKFEYFKSKRPHDEKVILIITLINLAFKCIATTAKEDQDKAIKCTSKAQSTGVTHRVRKHLWRESLGDVSDWDCLVTTTPFFLLKILTSAVLHDPWKTTCIFSQPWP